MPRLVWNGLQRARWSDGSQPWLAATLASAETALRASDAAALAAAAPWTDAATGAVLAGLPARFAATLALDMTLEAGGTDRLLIASQPGDGDAM